jgi:bifunctional enzyme CysN/CysC
VEIVLDRPLLLDPYSRHHDTGGFVLVDRLTARTVAAGMVRQPLVRESDVVRHRFRVSRADREAQNGIRGCVIWLTGLSGSGKSTIADALDARLHDSGIRSYTLDGDSVRAALSEDLGFSPEDRAENVRRVARVAEMMLDAGLVVIVSLVSPFRSDRLLAREHFADTDFFEIFVDTPLEECIRRDPKGLYARAATDSTISLTGISQAYERPEDPHLVLDGMAPTESSVEQLLGLILARRT